MTFKACLLGVAIGIALAGCEKRPTAREEYAGETTALATEGGEGLPYYVGKDLRPAWDTRQTPEVRELLPFKLTDQSGHPVDKKSLRGKVAVVSFFFSECPGICPMTTSNLTAVQKKFLNNDKVVMLSFSVTPEKDTPKKLNAYAKKYHIDLKRWKLLTGPRRQIYDLARQSFNADTFSEKENQTEKLNPEDFLHSENIYLLDAQQKIRGIYRGRDVSSVEQLATDAESLLQ